MCACDIHLTSKKYSIAAYSRRARNTKNMQAIIQDEIAVTPSTFGDIFVIALKVFVSTRKSVTSRQTLAGTISGGIKKLTHDTATNTPLGK